MVLDNIDPNHWDLGLERIRAALEILGNPQHSYRIVTVGGTNGKGSTVAYLERLLIAGGLRVGANISPHISRFAERVRINGVDQQNLDLIKTRIDDCLPDAALTYFEWCVVLAAVAFSEASVDVALFEVGMGGRLDAVNAFDTDLAIITNVDLDHTAFLGSTIPEIALEKVQISRRARPLISAAVEPARAVIAEYTAKIGARLIEVTEPAEYQTGISGGGQGYNAALALKAAECLGLELTVGQKRAALSSSFMPGRQESVGGRLIMDVAHNPASVLSLVQCLDQVDFRGNCVIGVLADKDYRSMLELLSCRCDQFYAAPLQSERSWSLAEIKSLPGSVVACQSVAEAFDAAGFDKPLLVTGSFLTVGEVRESIICLG